MDTTYDALETPMDATGDDFETVRLLRFEAVQLRSPTISRVTFYEGRPPLEFIKGKVAEICGKNPWLQGRLSGDKKSVLLRYPKSAGGVERFVRVASIPALRFDMGFADLANALKDLVIKRGSLCLNKDEDLFRVTVATISDDRFAVVVSMSHVYADAHTFYEIYKMLSSTEPVRPLIVDRIYSSRVDMDAAIRGGDDSLPWLSSPGFLLNVAGSLLRGRASTLNLFTIDQLMIDERKQEYATANKPDFISTNDIITAELFSHTACDLIFVAVNFRERIPHLTRNHAGNYECVIAFQREDFATPGLIHSAWADYRRALSGKLPGFFKAAGAKLGAVTNLASFYHDVVLPGCKLLWHRPVVDMESFLPFEHMVYIFKSQKDQLAVITYAKDTSALTGLAILKEQIV